MAKYDPTGATYVNFASGATGGAAANPAYVAPPTGTAYSATGTDVHATSATGTGDIAVGNYRELTIDILTTGTFTGTSVAFIVQRKDANGHYYAIASPAALTATAQSVNLDLGVGASTNKSFGNIIRIAWTATALTTATADFSVIGK